MPRFNVSSKECPVCGAKAVSRVERVWGFRSAAFKCESCGASLKTAVSPQVLWAVPVLAVMSAIAYFVAGWAKQAHLFGTPRTRRRSFRRVLRVVCEGRASRYGVSALALSTMNCSFVLFRVVWPNHSIERTSSSQLRCLAAAAHVELQGLLRFVKRH
jgi:hypothetical protein